jgi:hypothetical protein
MAPCSRRRFRRDAAYRHERQDLYLSSDLIREGVAATLALWPEPPALGMVTMIDPSKTRRKRDPGRCYRRAGFVPCGYTKGGLLVLQLTPDAMPAPDAALGTTAAMT